MEKRTFCHVSSFVLKHVISRFQKANKCSLLWSTQTLIKVLPSYILLCCRVLFLIGRVLMNSIMSFNMFSFAVIVAISNIILLKSYKFFRWKHASDAYLKGFYKKLKVASHSAYAILMYLLLIMYDYVWTYVRINIHSCVYTFIKVISVTICHFLQHFLLIIVMEEKGNSKDHLINIKQSSQLANVLTRFLPYIIVVSKIL